MRVRALVMTALVLSFALSAAAQQPVTLRFNDARVTLQARNAPVRAILAEWARLGGATIVNGDRVAGPAVTLELADVPERQALDIVLRGVAGYMLGPRRAGTPGASGFDRIVILPTSVAPRNPPPPAAAAGPRPGIAFPRPPVIARPPEAAVEPPDAPEEDASAAPGPIVSPPVVPPGNLPRAAAPAIVRPLPGIEAAQNDADADNTEETTPATATTPTPSNPFGVPAGSSARPGVVSPVPRPQSQQAPTNRVQ